MKPFKELTLKFEKLIAEFPTSRMEMNAVANMFDRNGDGYIDWKEFLAALRPDWEERPTTEDEIIHDEVKRQVERCTCRNRFKVHQVGEGQYRVSRYSIS